MNNEGMNYLYSRLDAMNNITVMNLNSIKV